MPDYVLDAILPGDTRIVAGAIAVAGWWTALTAIFVAFV